LGDERTIERIDVERALQDVDGARQILLLLAKDRRRLAKTSNTLLLRSPTFRLDLVDLRELAPILARLETLLEFAAERSARRRRPVASLERAIDAFLIALLRPELDEPLRSLLGIRALLGAKELLERIGEISLLATTLVNTHDRTKRVEARRVPVEDALIDVTRAI